MQTVDEFTPSTTEPVFGSGLVSQTKSQPSTNNDTNDNEKVIPPSEPVVNGQNEATVNKLTSSENITNGTNETDNGNSGATDLSTVHVNGQHEKPTVEVNDEVKSVSAVEQPIVPPTESEPVSSAPVDNVNEVSSTAVDTAPIVEEPTTTTAASTEVVNDNVPEVPVATESEPTEVKSKSPRGRAKAAPVVLTTPTRQSSRGRKPASSSNVEESPSTDETSSSSSSQRTKRQAATLAKDAIAASSQANSTDDVHEQDVVPTDVVGDNNITEGQTNASPSPGKKRGASKSTPPAAKKARGQNSLTPTNDVNTEATENEGEIVQTPPPKKARTSATKKTPEPPSEEYARKLRPRK